MKWLLLIVVALAARVFDVHLPVQLSVVTAFILLLLVPLYWPLIGIGR